MRVADLHNEFMVDQLKLELLKLMAIDIRFLDFKLSHRAASALTIAKNMLDLRRQNLSFSPDNSKMVKGVVFDLSLWNEKLESET